MPLTSSNCHHPVVCCLVLLGFLAFFPAPSDAQLADKPNGFDVSNATIPLEEIRHGGPPRDGIPAILSPRFESVAEADRWLRPDDRVIGLVINGEARCYPQRITVWHEIVNDTVGGQPVVVTYCPLCGTSMVFEGIISGQNHSFGVSGLLYQSDVLMYDHQTESLWSQLKMSAVSGPKVGTPLSLLPSELTNWADWKSRYPDSEVLSRDTGTPREYDQTPYASYFASPDTMFPVPFERTELAKKDWVLGVIVNGKAQAYPIATLDRISVRPVFDSIDGIELALAYDAQAQRLTVTRTESGDRVAVVRAYWFAWQAFYPDTEVYGRNRR